MRRPSLIRMGLLALAARIPVTTRPVGAPAAGSSEPTEDRIDPGRLCSAPRAFVYLFPPFPFLFPGKE
jgi:hypothetical protein